MLISATPAPNVLSILRKTPCILRANIIFMVGYLYEGMIIPSGKWFKLVKGYDQIKGENMTGSSGCRYGLYITYTDLEAEFRSRGHLMEALVNRRRQKW